MNELEQLNEKLTALKKVNETNCAEKINEILKEYNCSLVCNAEVVINSSKVIPIIVSN